MALRLQQKGDSSQNTYFNARKTNMCNIIKKCVRAWQDTQHNADRRTPCRRWSLKTMLQHEQSQQHLTLRPTSVRCVGHTLSRWHLKTHTNSMHSIDLETPKSITHTKKEKNHELSNTSNYIINT